MARDFTIKKRTTMKYTLIMDLAARQRELESAGGDADEMIRL